MEMTLNMGTFEALDQQELSSTTGGDIGTVLAMYSFIKVAYNLYQVGKGLYDLGYSNGKNSVLYGG